MANRDIENVTETDSLINRCSSPMRNHHEPHFDNADVVRDIIIGLSDGLTVPFALAAGLSYLDNSTIIVTAGFAEIIAGAISMGLGGYLAGKSEIEHYDSERLRELKEVKEVPEVEEEEICEIFGPYGLIRSDLEPMLAVLRRDSEKWVDFMMKFELNLERPSPKRSWISALTIGSSYLLGGVVPLVPYIVVADTQFALFISSISTLIVLLIFGFIKAKVLGIGNPTISAFQTMFIGAVAAIAAYGIAKIIPDNESLQF